MSSSLSSCSHGSVPYLAQILRFGCRRSARAASGLRKPSGSFRQQGSMLCSPSFVLRRPNEIARSWITSSESLCKKQRYAWCYFQWCFSSQTSSLKPALGRLSRCQIVSQACSLRPYRTWPCSDDILSSKSMMPYKASESFLDKLKWASHWKQSWLMVIAVPQDQVLPVISFLTDPALWSALLQSSWATAASLLSWC